VVAAIDGLPAVEILVIVAVLLAVGLYLAHLVRRRGPDVQRVLLYVREHARRHLVGGLEVAWILLLLRRLIGLLLLLVAVPFAHVCLSLHWYL